MDRTIEGKQYKGRLKLQYIKEIMDDVNYETCEKMKRNWQNRSQLKTAQNQS